MTHHDLSGKVALITGAARGQGRAEAELFARSGATVIAADLDASVDDLPDGVEYRRLDVTSETDWADVVGSIHTRHGRLDILVNNAGLWQPKRILETTADDFAHLFRVNQLGILLGIRTAAPRMIEQGGGSIVNIASGSAWYGMEVGGPYGSTKWGVRGLTRSAARELGPQGIRVNTVFPGLIATGMSADAAPDILADLIAHTPLRRAGQPEEVAEVVAFFASDAASFVTGAEVAVDGGNHA